jgi:host factor-I protein
MYPPFGASCRLLREPKWKEPTAHATGTGEGTVETAKRRPSRQSLNEPRDQMATRKAPPTNLNKKSVPPDQTNAENYYYVKQMQTKTPMVIVLQDGESLTGVIEWYDKRCLKVNREGAPNLLVFKPNIKYMYKA